MSQQQISLSHGISCLKQGDIKEAVETFENFCRRNPDSGEGFVYLAAAYTQQERHNLAIGALKRASDLNPKSAKIHFSLGQSYETAGVPQEALVEYKRALEIDPDYGLAKGAYMSLYKRLPKLIAQSIEITM